MLKSDDAALFRSASIAFDLDGTLADTAPDLVRVLNRIVVPRGVAPVALAEVRSMVGHGARALLQRAFERSDRPLEDGDALLAEFLALYEADIAVDTRVFPGVTNTLDWLCEQGASLSVCTNKPSLLSDMLVDRLGLSRWFVRIVGPERTTAKKPAAAHLLDALGSGYERAALVGDSAPDVESARAAGLPSIVLGYGYSEKPADSLGAGRVIHAFDEVPQALVDLWRADA
jgi:phosphoglycolate phosphatase